MKVKTKLKQNYTNKTKAAKHILFLIWISS